MATEAKQALSRETVVTAALAMADADGLEAVSFRRLAAELGVTPMALYRHVAHKDELLAAMMDRVFTEFEMPPRAGGDWREELRAFARAFRRLLLAHPSAATLYFAGIETVFPSGLRIVEALLELLVRAGFSNEQAALLEGSLERNVLSLTLFETRAAAAETPEEQAAHVEGRRAMLRSLPADAFPHVIAAPDALCGAVDPEAAFEFAVDLLLGGLEHLLATGERARA